MSEPTTISINDIKYVRADSVPQHPLLITTKRIIVADRGWIFAGDCEDHADGSVTIHNCKNIRRWGTTAGLGQLIDGPLTDTKVDTYGTVRTIPIAQIAVRSGW